MKKSNKRKNDSVFINRSSIQRKDGGIYIVDQDLRFIPSEKNILPFKTIFCYRDGTQLKRLYTYEFSIETGKKILYTTNWVKCEKCGCFYTIPHNCVKEGHCKICGRLNGHGYGM